MQYEPILRRTDPAHRRPAEAIAAEDHLAELGDRCGDFALQCSDVAGFVNQVHQRIADDNQRLAQLEQSVTGLTKLQAEANDAAAEIRFVAKKATALITDSHSAVLNALGDIGALIDDVVRMGEQLEGFVDTIEQVNSVSDELDGITQHTRMLAINATIEAARAEHGSSGFAVVAAEMKRLAVNARAATSSVTETIARLEGGARAVIDDVRDGAQRGRAARARAGEISDALETIAALVTQFDQRSSAIEACGADVTRHIATLGDGLTGFARSAAANAGELNQMRERLDGLEVASNEMLDRVAHSGVATHDGRFVTQALAQAAEVSKTIEAALDAGRLTHKALFDADYQPVAGSDPAQFLTDFVPFADTVLRPLLDRWTEADAAIVGCCLLDRNGYLPTHITPRSAPQRPGQRQWNLEHSRNRLIFMDHQVRAALDSNNDFRLFAYRQDFGDGRYRALRSVFVPLAFGGRKWGLYELGYLI